MEVLKNHYFSLKENLSGLKSSLKFVKTIFGEVSEERVTFCFDSSGSMYRVFYHFREQLIEKLFQMFFSEKSQKFNVILFNTSIHQCFPKHVKCTYDNIIHVIPWMNKPYYESRSNMLGGLLKSFEDYPDVVYLITDGFPSSDRDELLEHLAYISKGRQIRSIMITSEVPPEACALDFMENVAHITGGSLSVISISDFGAVEVLMPIYYEPRTSGVSRATFTSFFDKKKDLIKERSRFKKTLDCSVNEFPERTLQGDPLSDLPLVVPFVSKDPLSGKSCPFYHPYYQWYWPQYWQEHGPGPCCMSVKADKQYNCMWSNFRESRAFISGRKYLETYQNPKRTLPCAGMMLINKKVLACNHKDSNNYYRGKVLSQVSPIHFLVNFDISGDYNEAQKTAIGEIIDFDDQRRHSINVGDYVLAPLNSEMEVYHMGVVLAGNENRSLTKTILPIQNKILSVNFFSNNISKDVEPNTSIFLTSSLKNIIERYLNKSLTDPQNEDEDEEDEYGSLYSLISEQGTNNNNAETDLQKIMTKETFCPCSNFNHCCCTIDKLHRCISGRVASPVDDGKAVTLELIKEQIKKNKSYSFNEVKEDNGCACNEDVENEEKSKKEGEEKLKTKEIVKDEHSDLDSDDDSIYYNKKNTDQFTETDLNWCILRILNKHSKSKTNKNERPPWKYWGHKNIPDVIDPPNSEPYDDPPFWGCLMPKPVAEWPSVNFQEVNPHIVTNTSPKKMYDLFKHQIHHPSKRPKRDASVGRDSLPSEEITTKLLERRFNYLQGGYPKAELRNPYKDSVKPILSSFSAVGSVRNNKSLESCLNKLEKSRIECQIERDQANLLRYVENKPKLKPSLVHS